MQLELMHESIDDALGFLVQALGGAKKVGAAMRPELPVDQSAAWVRDCLNTTRRERFTPAQVMWLLRAGRQAGVHSAMHFIASEAGYCPPAPIEPDDEPAELQREFIAAQERMAKLVSRMERAGVLRSVA